MKNIFKKSIISLVIAIAVSPLISCENDNNNPNKLATPTNLTVDTNRTLKWDLVKNADRYIVSVSRETNSFEYFTVKNELTITETKKGEYALKVKALNSTGLLKESKYSKPYYYTIDNDILISPVIDINDRDVSWGVVSGATAYEIYINNTKEDFPSINIDGGICHYKLDNKEPGTYIISVKAVNSDGFSDMSNEVTYFAERPDSSGQWSYDTFDETWKGGSTIFQGYNLYAFNNSSISVENYVSIPEGKPYFKFYSMRLGDAFAAPEMTVYVKDDEVEQYQIVRAIGAEDDYVLNDVANKVTSFVYDFSSFEGPIKIKITARNSNDENGVNIALPAIGFSEFGREEHLSAKNEWSQTDVYLDWNNQITSMATGQDHGYLALSSNEYISNVLNFTNEKNAIKFLGTGCGSFKVYVDDKLSDVAPIETTDGTVFDFSDYIGKAVDVKFVSSGYGTIYSIEKASYIREYDSTGFWGYDEMNSKWSGGNKIFQGYQLYTGSSTTISTSNYVTIPQGKPYFKFSVMKFGDAIAKPNFKVYVKSNGVTSVVKAVGYNTDYVQIPEANMVYTYAYDLSNYPSSVSIKIEATNSLGQNGVNIAFQSMGFSEYGKTDHLSTLTSWNDAQIYTDWNSDVMLALGADGRCWPAITTSQELSNVISVTSQLNALKVYGLNIANLKLYVNNAATPITAKTENNYGIFDLSSYSGQTIKIRLVGNGNVIIKSIEQFIYNG